MVEMITIDGVAEVKAAMQKANKKLGHNSQIGITKATLFLQRESQKIVPVLTGNLKNSAGSEVQGSGWYADGVVYYTAAYAVYVHEREDLTHKKGKTHKFLEKPARIHRATILAIIAGEMDKPPSGSG